MLKSQASVQSYLDDLLHEKPKSVPGTDLVSAPKPAKPAVAPKSVPGTDLGSDPKCEPVPNSVPGTEKTGEQRRRASDRLDRWIGFSIAGQVFGVEVLSVLEVQRVGEITPTPGAGADILGAINLRGQIVPVLDLGPRLGFARREPTPSSRLIVVDHQGSPVGLCVDGVSEVITARISAVEPAPKLGGRIDSGWVRGVLRHKADTVLLLDPNKLLAP